jgi:hypothetical protein
MEVLAEITSKLGPLGEKYKFSQEANDEFASVEEVKLYSVSEVLNFPSTAFRRIRDALRIHEFGDANQGELEEVQVLTNLLEIEGSLEGPDVPATPGSFVRAEGSVKQGVQATLQAGAPELAARVAATQVSPAPAPEPAPPKVRILTGDDAVQNGLNRLGAWCEKKGEPVSNNVSDLVSNVRTNATPRRVHDFRRDHRYGKILEAGDHKWLFRCVKPWMWELLQARRTYLKRLNEKPAELYKSHTELASLVGIITKGGSFPQFLAWLGETNYAYQVRVSGFRPGSEQGDTEFDIGMRDYVSATLGSAQPEMQGTIQSLVREKKLSPDTVTNLLGGLSGAGN